MKLSKVVAIFMLLLAVACSYAQTDLKKKEVYPVTSCMGCHGQNAMGGLGPPLAQTKVGLSTFRQVVRNGKGMMPAISEADLSDTDLDQVYEEVKAKPWIPDEIPIAFKVGQFLTPRSVSHFFIVVFLFATVFAIRGLSYWLKCAGLKELKPAIAKFGWARSFGVVLKSLIVDGFFVGSLWQNNKKRWFMHGLLLYGFCGLLLADILIAILNPQRGEVPLTHPLKLLPVVSGIAVLVGVFYVMYRYKKDEFIDNGLTLGKDFLFVNLLVHVIISGFLVVALKRMGIHDFVMTIYIWHLAAVALLIATGPFTRFQHMYVVPALAAMTRLTEAIVASGVELGFEREPSPGRHHKSMKIASDVMKQLGEDGPITMRYYP